jgi:hypothetical protein
MFGNLAIVLFMLDLFKCNIIVLCMKNVALEHPKGILQQKQPKNNEDVL